MDVTTISSPCGGLNETRNIVQYAGNDETNAKVAAFFGRKSDALSAVKLDPAVLEAQVTIETPEMDEYSLNIRPVEHKESDGLVKHPIPEPRTRPPIDFEAMVKKQEAALLSLTPGQMDLLMRFTDTLRRQRQAAQKHLECSFCKNNGEAVSWYSSHCLKDSRGCVKCPVLRSFRCHLCGATGDRAHTIKYCPDNILLDADYWSR